MGLRHNATTMGKYLIYSRKSSESEDRQVLSIPAQLSELGDIAAREGFDVATTYQESMSAKASGRPVFSEMLKVIEKGDGYWTIARRALSVPNTPKNYAKIAAKSAQIQAWNKKRALHAGDTVRVK